MPLIQSTITNYDASTPTGAIELFGGTAIPRGWLVCDGSSVSRTQFPALWGLIGVSFGSPDNATTFKLPDLRGRVPVGYAPRGGHSDVSTIGNADAVAAANRRPSHNHTNSLTASHTLAIPNHTHTADTNHSHSGPSWPGGNGHYDDGAGQARAVSGGNEGTSSATAGLSVGAVSGSYSTFGGSISVGGTVGPAGTNASDLHPYLVLHYIIKT